MHRLFLYTGILVLIIGCQNEPSPPLSPQEAINSFQLPDGYKIQLVAAEPMVQDPVVIKFDDAGRIWVVEMRGFMPDIDGHGEDQPTGRVSILSDVDADGRMDQSVVFVDSLVLPRALALVQSGALIVEDHRLWYMEDRDGDLKADYRIMVDSAYGKKGVIEHSPNGLWRGIDNWYYNAKSEYRYRLKDGNWIKDKTEFRGQWGISHDNYGRLYYNYNWSQLHADLVPPNYLSANPNHTPTSGIDHPVSQDRQIFPIRENPAINRGYIPGTLDANGRLIEFTSACAPFVYRGDLFGEEMVGDAFVCEPTGNLIKHNKISEQGIIPTATLAYQDSEFVASTDERFRPVGITSGPDGALYVADLYRGIIQHGPYMSPYLREITLQRKLDHHIHLGRIWRISPENKRSDPVLNLGDLPSQELVNTLGHPNGWYRDLAQRLLVERGDSTVTDLITKMVLNNQNELAGLHGVWTLEGLEFNDVNFYFDLINQSAPVIQAAAIRVLEPIISENPHLQEQFLNRMPQTGEPGVDLQMALSSRILPRSEKFKNLAQIISIYQDQQIFRDAVISSLANEEFQFLELLLEQPNWKDNSREKAITIELLTTAVTRKKDPQELKGLLARLSNEPEAWKQSAMITGMSFHDTPQGNQLVELSEQPEILTNEQVKAQHGTAIQRISQLFDWPGKIETFKASDSVKLADPETLATGRNLYLTVCSNCHGSEGKGLPRFGPPLAGSDWVLGNPERLVRILLHGMEGPLEVNGRNYDTPDILPVMPAFANTSANDLAAVMTYIRQEWGNNANEIEPGLVGKIRVQTQGKVTPWTVEELRDYTIDD